MQTFCTAFSILCLGYVLGSYRGVPGTGIMAWLTACIASLGFSLWSHGGVANERRAKLATPYLLTATFGMFAALQMTSGTFGFFIGRMDISLWILSIAGAAIYFGFAAQGLTLRVCRRRMFPIILAGFLIVAIRTISEDPHPKIDVHLVQQAGVEALFHGKNPFEATVVDIYGPTSPYFNSLVENGRTKYGFTYPPLIAVLELPSYALTGEVRYTYVVVLLLTSCLIFFTRESWNSLAAAVLLLINPFTLVDVDYSWVEPFGLLFLALCLYAAPRYPKALPYLFGLFLACKQTNMALLPLAPFLIAAPWTWKDAIRFISRALLVVAVVYVPFYFWNPHAFLLSLVTVQLNAGFRSDLISYAAFAARRNWMPIPGLLSFLYLPLGLYASWSTLARTPRSFALASVVTLLPFFALSKQGAPNYYFYCLGALCCVLALSDDSDPNPGLC